MRIHEFSKQNLLDKQNAPQLTIQQETLEFISDKQKIEVVEQFFFLNAGNQVTLLHPNYHSKSDTFRMVDLICKQASIQQLDPHNHKRINYIEMKETSYES